MLPDGSYALHCNSCDPAVALRAFHLVVNGAVVDVAIKTPSTEQSVPGPVHYQ